MFFLIALIFLSGCTKQQVTSGGEGLTITTFSPDFSEIGGGSRIGVILVAKNVGESNATDIKVFLSGLPWDVKQEEFQPKELLGADTQFGFKGEEGIAEWLLDVPRKDITETYTMLADLHYGYTTSSIIFLKVFNLDYFKSLPESERGSLPNSVQSIKTTSGPLSVSITIDQRLLTATDVPVVFEITNVGNGKTFIGDTPKPETVDTILVTIDNQNVRCPDKVDKFKVRLVQGKTGRLLCRLFTGDVNTFDNILIDLKAEYRYFIEGKTTLKVLKTPYELPFSDVSASGSSVTLDSYDGTNVQGKIDIRVKNRGTTPMENVEAQASWKLPAEQSFTELSNCKQSFGTLERDDIKTFPCNINLPVNENNKLNIKVTVKSTTDDNSPKNNEVILEKLFVYEASFVGEIKPIIRSVKDTTVNYELPVKIRNTGNIVGKGIDIKVLKADETVCETTTDLTPNVDFTLTCPVTQTTTDTIDYTASIERLPAESDKFNNAQVIKVSYQDTTSPTVEQSEIYQGTTFQSNNVWWYNGTISIRAKASDVESGIKECEYTLDNGASWVKTGATYDGTYCKADNLQDPNKDITINFRATNNAGLQTIGTSKTYKHTIAPTITVTAVKTFDNSPYTFGTWVNSDIRVTISCQEKGGVSCKTIKYCADKKPDTDPNKCIPSIDYIQLFTISTDKQTFVTDIKTSEGIIYLRYTITDTLQNTIDKTLLVKIDKTLPDPSDLIVAFPADGTYHPVSDPPSRQITGDAKDKIPQLVGENIIASGLPANFIKFYLKRVRTVSGSGVTDYWTGTGNNWGSTITWLSTTHSETENNNQIRWTSVNTLPSTWEVGNYFIHLNVTDKAGNSREKETTFGIIP